MKKVGFVFAALILSVGFLAQASLDDDLAAAKKTSEKKAQSKEEAYEAKQKQDVTTGAALFFNAAMKHLKLTTTELKSSVKGYESYDLTFKYKMRLSNGKICTGELTGSDFSGLHEKKDRRGNDDTDFLDDDLAIISGMCTQAQMHASEVDNAEMYKIADGILFGLGQWKQNIYAKGLINHCHIQEYKLDLDCYDTAGNNTGYNAEGYGSLIKVKFKEGY